MNTGVYEATKIMSELSAGVSEPTAGDSEMTAGVHERPAGARVLPQPNPLAEPLTTAKRLFDSAFWQEFRFQGILENKFIV